MADVKKQEKDYTKEVDQLIPEAESIARVSFGGTTESQIRPLINDWAHRLCYHSCSQESFRKAWKNCLHWRNRQEMYASVSSGLNVGWTGLMPDE